RRINERDPLLQQEVRAPRSARRDHHSRRRRPRDRGQALAGQTQATLALLYQTFSPERGDKTRYTRVAERRAEGSDGARTERERSHDGAAEVPVALHERRLASPWPVLASAEAARRADRALRAARISSDTDRGAEVHERVVPPRRVAPRHEGGVELQRLTLGGGPSEERPTEHAPDVRVRERHRVVVREARHRTCGVRADAGQRVQLGRGPRKPGRAGTGGAVEITRAPVVAEAGPLAEHVAERRAAERAKGGEPAQESGVRPKHADDLGLLEHDLGHEDRVRIAGAAPRQVAGRAAVPRQQPASKGCSGCAGVVQFRAQNSTPGRVLRASGLQRFSILGRAWWDAVRERRLRGTISRT